MTTISKKILAKRLEEKVYQTFWETVVKINKTNEASIFFADLFTKTELVNFTKRLSIVVLLHKEYDWREICDLLKVSPNTVAKMAAKMRSEGFNLFFAKIARDKEWEQFWKDLGKLYLNITHPEKVGRLNDEGIEAIYFRSKKKTLI